MVDLGRGDPLEQPDALILTAIGIGTAFGVLILLLVIVLLIRLVSWIMNRYTGGRQQVDVVETPDPEMRNRARAAAIAVTALIESQPHLTRLPDDVDQ